eukprot:TRINITY_DN8200_c1_g1_i1.p1 TRINITY_DN8200_c1_g1~~TRINITY_DN8200_c1_g1_i1.p1  ORF type:complete len:204 (-),score=14.04 TRINITY_DN8200_c1_g1_i1:93-677(-)
MVPSLRILLVHSARLFVNEVPVFASAPAAVGASAVVLWVLVPSFVVAVVASVPPCAGSALLSEPCAADVWVCSQIFALVLQQLVIWEPRVCPPLLLMHWCYGSRVLWYLRYACCWECCADMGRRCSGNTQRCNCLGMSVPVARGSCRCRVLLLCNRRRLTKDVSFFGEAWGSVGGVGGSGGKWEAGEAWGSEGR